MDVELKQSKLNEILPKFAINKSEYESYKALVDREKKQIKSLLADIGQTEWQVGNNKVELQERISQQIDEDKLVEYLKSINATDCIKIVECVDSDKLENAIYHGIITASQVKEMDRFTTEKKVVAVKLSKIKEI